MLIYKEPHGIELIQSHFLTHKKTTTRVILKVGAKFEGVMMSQGVTKRNVCTFLMNQK